MRIAVTGSTSAIARILMTELSLAGHSVIEMGGSNSSVWRLGQGFPPGVEADLLIHLAHDRSLSLKENSQVAQVLCASFVGPKIFLSSFSAHSKSLSRYGKSKYAMEQIFNCSNGSSIRAGIIYGGEVAGIFEQLQNLITKFPIIPILFRGRPLMFTTHIEDLVSEIVSKIGASDGRTTFSAHPLPISLENLCIQIRNSLGSSKLCVRIPKQPIDWFSKTLVQIFPNFPMLDSLLSLSCEANYEELSKLKVSTTKFRPFELGS
jgi:hypothetical protein